MPALGETAFMLEETEPTDNITKLLISQGCSFSIQLYLDPPNISINYLTLNRVTSTKDSLSTLCVKQNAPSYRFITWNPLAIYYGTCFQFIMVIGTCSCLHITCCSCFCNQQAILPSGLHSPILSPSVLGEIDWGSHSSSKGRYMIPDRQP